MLLLDFAVQCLLTGSLNLFRRGTAVVRGVVAAVIFTITIITVFLMFLFKLFFLCVFRNN